MDTNLQSIPRIGEASRPAQPGIRFGRRPLLPIAAIHPPSLMRRADNEMTLRGGWVVEFVALPATSRGGVGGRNRFGVWRFGMRH